MYGSPRFHVHTRKMSLFTTPIGPLRQGLSLNLTFSCELAGKPLKSFLCPSPPTVKSTGFELRASHFHRQCSHPQRHVPSSTAQHSTACKGYTGKDLYLLKSTIKKLK